MPCKSDCHPIFGIAELVTLITHVLRHFGALRREQKKSLEETVMIIMSEICGKTALIVCKIT